MRRKHPNTELYVSRNRRSPMTSTAALIRQPERRPAVHVAMPRMDLQLATAWD
jgi:hypothetical protein